ncbi:MAG: GNAT family N-acetyltransferase [Clostridia bacterium]|nr:GNAT family N-acetyltransferase [Clostridia bacterium]
MEILYFTRNFTENIEMSQTIRWLTVDDYDRFCEHLSLCGQHVLELPDWKQAYAEGTVYCGLFIGGKIVCRACVEKYSSHAWEVADVRTARPYRGNGYARQVCAFVLKYILQQGRTATIRTEEDNLAMKNVIADLGFSIL